MLQTIFTSVAKKPGPSSPPQPRVEAKDAAPATSCEEKVRTLAYEKWEAAGCPAGDGIEFWVAAERELAAQTSQQSGD